jgi:hypothetical protein
MGTDAHTSQSSSGKELHSKGGSTRFAPGPKLLKRCEIAIYVARERGESTEEGILSEPVICPEGQAREW